MQGKEGAFDFAYMDANKEDYIKYHEQLLKMVKIGGIIAYDNTLWCGSVVVAENDVMNKEIRKCKKYFIEWNNFLANDPRIESSLISIVDGPTLCRRLY
jgi:caffeoyl-CoA O-methyltransferase